MARKNRLGDIVMTYPNYDVKVEVFRGWRLVYTAEYSVNDAYEAIKYLLNDKSFSVKNFDKIKLKFEAVDGYV